MMWDALMIGTGFVAGVAGTVALAVRWYERPQDWCGGTDGAVYLAGYQHGRRDGAKPPDRNAELAERQYAASRRRLAENTVAEARFRR